MQFFASLQSFFDPFLLFLSADPILRMMQGGLLFIGFVVIFLVFFVTRDILLRTHSFLYMTFCILLTALLPGVGFLLYLLIRPARTIREREQETLVLSLSAKLLGKPRSGKKSSSQD
ncbi:MAG: hypothetical protein PHX87_03620 [Candidatus Peribacteraceae bacterium]|nr:hypothetical protein [Candidatus Peribacteraceae bacterium]MDD5742494.1 hypothetical protein [Candidatus Peribacteraceae bacterium]